MNKYDVIVIGSGAGNIIVEEATKIGLKCALIEKDKFGGTCLNRGCIPTKIMVTAAEELRNIKKASKLGINVENVTLDWNVLSSRVWNKIDENKELKDFYQNDELVDIYQGKAYFLSNKVVEVELNDSNDKVQLTADKIIINVGGRSNVAYFDGLKEVGYLTSETFFGEKYPKEPYKELIIMGGGPIGTEFASTFAALGTKVTLVQRNVRLLPKEEEEISALIKKYMKDGGVEVLLNKTALSIEKEGDKKVLTVVDKTTGEETKIKGDEILIAAGIVSNADTLKLENTGIEVDSRGWIRTNEFLETTVEGVWAIGDINGNQQFRHKANYDADTLAYNLFMSKGDEDFRWVAYDVVPAVTFSYPEVAHVGISEKEALEKGLNIKVGKNRYAMTAKGYALGFDMEDGLDAFAKMIVDKDSGNIIGMHVVGPMASAIIQPYVLHMNLGKHKLTPINEDIETEFSKKMRKKAISRKLKPKKFTSVRETIVPHPTLSEVTAWTFYHMEDVKDNQ